MQQSAIVNSNDASIIQREKEISELAKGIIELADIFKELQTMVIDQGTMLDRIDYNIENMVSHVKGAEKELVQVDFTSLWCSFGIPNIEGNRLPGRRSILQKGK